MINGIIGVGRAMQRQLAEQEAKRTRDEQFAREEDRATRSAYTKYFEDVINNPDKWPTGAGEAASKMYWTIVSNPKLKGKDLEKMANEFMQATSRHRAADVLGLRKAEGMQQHAGQFEGLVPGAGEMSTMAGEFADAIPRREVTGPLTSEEQFERRMPMIEREMEFKNELEKRFTKPQWIEMNPGTSLVGVNTHTGKQVGDTIQGPGAIPRRDTSITPEEVAMNVTGEFTPEQVKEANRIIALKNSNSSSSGSPGTWVGSQPFIKDGRWVVARVNNKDPNAPAVVTDLGPAEGPGAMARPESEDAKTKRVQLQGMQSLTEEVLNTLKGPKGKAVAGAGSTAMYKARAMGLPLVGDNDPDVVRARSFLSKTASEELNRLSGAAISPMEYNRLSGFIPAPDKLWQMSDAELLSKVQAFKEALDYIVEARYGANGIGADFGRDVLGERDSRTNPQIVPTRDSVGRPTPTTVPPGVNAVPPPPPGYTPVG